MMKTGSLAAWAHWSFGPSYWLVLAILAPLSGTAGIVASADGDPASSGSGLACAKIVRLTLAGMDFLRSPFWVSFSQGSQSESTWTSSIFVRMHAMRRSGASPGNIVLFGPTYQSVPRHATKWRTW